jgi:hypothetical protein
VFLAIAVAAMTAWGTLALSYRLLPDGVLRGFIFAFWLAAFLVALWGLLRRCWLALLAYSLALAALFVWWSGIEPRNDRDWAPDVARTLTGTIDGHSVHLTNARNFDWRSDSDFTERWEERTYDLDQLDSLDLINSYWAGPVVAHTLLSFGFSDGRHLVFSIEIRRKRGDVYSVLSGFFKENELTIIGADERDIIRIRSNIRGEDVQLFSLRAPAQRARDLFQELVAEANDLAARPRFYNTITQNCAPVLCRLARNLNASLPLDWRIILSGYLPDYAYKNGLLDRDLPLAEIRERGRINERARAADQSGDFSRLIRVGVRGW